MLYIITTLVGVFIGLTFDTTLYPNQIEDATKKCAVNGTIKSIRIGILSVGTVLCGNSAKFHLVEGVVNEKGNVK